MSFKEAELQGLVRELTDENDQLHSSNNYLEKKLQLANARKGIGLERSEYPKGFVAGVIATAFVWLLITLL